MKKNQSKTIRNIAIILIACLAGAWAFNLIPGYPGPFSTAGDKETRIVTDTMKEDYRKGLGRWNVLETVVDTLDIATVRTSATNYKLYWYTRRGEVWKYHETGNDKYVTLEPADNANLWVVVTIPSGQAFYVDYKRIMRESDYITDYDYIDVDGDGVKEFAFKYNMMGHYLPSNGYPSISFMGYIATYDASFTGINDLANETGIGGSTVTKYKSYYLSFNAATKAVAIYEIEVKITSTDDTKIRLKKLNVPGLGYLDGSSFTKSHTASDYRYTLRIATQFDGALLLKHPSNALNEYDMTLGLEYTLSASDDILVTLTVKLLVAQTEAGTTKTDSFYAQYS